jgi:peptidase E
MVPDRPRQVFAFSGILNRPPGQKRDPALLEYAVSLAAGDGKKRVCFIPTADGVLPAGYATEDGVGLHYIGTQLHEAVAMQDSAQAWWVEPSPGGAYHDEPIPPRRL